MEILMVTFPLPNLINWQWNTITAMIVVVAVGSIVVRITPDMDRLQMRNIA